ncbi:MAG: MarR family winged helix-turn-helix transcriptional regulator [Rhodospirillales bacterium]
MTATRPRNASQAPKESEPAASDRAPVDLDILQGLLSYYVRSLNVCLSRDLDRCMQELPVARGTGKISTLLLVSANPGIKPSTVAQIIQKDRSAVVRLLDAFKTAGLLTQRVSPKERRSHELYLTAAGEALATQVRAIASAQDKHFSAVLSPAELDQLLHLLRRLYDHHVGGAR